MRMIEISEDKHEKLSENMEKVLKYGGKVMQCIEEMKEEAMGHRGGGSMGRRYGDMGERDGYGNRGGYGNRDDDDDDDDYPMGERRRRRSNGRFY